MQQLVLDKSNELTLNEPVQIKVSSNFTPFGLFYVQSGFSTAFQVHTLSVI